jgi:hypothetical protein
LTQLEIEQIHEGGELSETRRDGPAEKLEKVFEGVFYRRALDAGTRPDRPH